MTKVKEEKLDKESQNYIKYLYKHREMLIKTRIDLDNSFDKYVLTFATGSLYLSILFTNNLGKPFEKEYLLFFGWLAFVVSICTMLLSILWSVKAYEIEEENIKKMIEVEENNQESLDCDNHWYNQINFTENIGIGSFMLGVILLTFFYLNNIT